MKWIKCKDIEPPREGKFLGYSPSNPDCPIYVLQFDRGVKYKGEFERCSRDDCYREASGEQYFTWEPTHWMPLPSLDSIEDNSKN